MDYTVFTTRECYNLACSELGLEDKHTICIAQLLELATKGYLDPLSAQRMAQIIYDHGANESLYCYEEEPEWEEPDWGDEGFDPYMGCYTGDC
jgi:hypothetical protein